MSIAQPNQYPLRARREANGVTLIQVAVRAQVSTNTAAKYELIPHAVRLPQRKRLDAVYDRLGGRE